MQDIEKLVETAVDYRQAALRARNLGIINISYLGYKNEAFQIYGVEDFAKLIEGKKYTVAEFNYTRLKYTCVISNLTFFCITDKLLFEGDENKIEEEV
jgi:hypothetical protein